MDSPSKRLCGCFCLVACTDADDVAMTTTTMMERVTNGLFLIGVAGGGEPV